MFLTFLGPPTHLFDGKILEYLNISIQNNTEYYGEYFKKMLEYSLFPNVFIKLLVICYVVLFLSCLTFENSEVPYL